MYPLPHLPKTKGGLVSRDFFTLYSNRTLSLLRPPCR